MSSAAVAKRVLVYGGSGALGDALVAHFKNRGGYWIVSVDLKENANANANILVNVNASVQDQFAQIDSSLTDMMSSSEDGSSKLDAILNVAGGWAGGNAANAQFINNSELMVKQSVGSSLVAAHLAAKHLKSDGHGVVTLPGAAAPLANEPTPGMIGYGMAKAAVHHLTKSLAHEASGLPKGTFVAALCPITLDTPMNRKWMPKADHSTWTSLSYIAELFEKWINNEERPASGSLVKLTTAEGKTDIQLS